MPVSFIDALGQSSNFDVYINNNKVGSFSPGRKYAKELSDLSECRTTHYSD